MGPLPSLALSGLIPGRHETGGRPEDTLTANLVSAGLNPAKARKIARRALRTPDPTGTAADLLEQARFYREAHAFVLARGISARDAHRMTARAIAAHGVLTADLEHGRTLDHTDRTGETAAWNVDVQRASGGR
ncbi:hypothetical protein GCM10023221_35660 [Luteimicrobium xylanilyticum]|uniref:Uncharacterized protein n=1 Tax=Luteimicrobium xylanilyticum TaxID=1133546 RepID=A0A5P9Q9C6_9MICO|nr:hypothetical protein KDY119_01382 [Luteimicrobium xylanilyticum]